MALGDGVDERIELVGVRLLVAGEEEVEIGILGVGVVGIGEAHRGGADVVGVEDTPRSEGLEALVVARGAVTGVRDRGDRARGIDQGDHGAVEVAGVGEFGVHVHADRADLGDVTEEEAGRVEVVDRHVLEDAPGHRDVGLRRCRRIAGDDRDLLQGADAAGLDDVVDLLEGRVETTVEPHHDEGVEPLEATVQLVDGGGVHGDGLLAQGRLAGLRGLDDVVHVQGGRRADDDGVDLGIGEDCIDVVGGARPVRVGQGLRGIGDDVGDERQGGVGVAGDRAGVDVGNPACADEANSQHCALPCVMSVMSVVPGSGAPGGRFYDPEGATLATHVKCTHKKSSFARVLTIDD